MRFPSPCANTPGFWLPGRPRSAYRWGVGIEVWVLVALVAILSAYLLPFLVGRREVMRRSNADDRYSSELRVLATGDALASDASDEDCDGGGRAQIFRRRPEVKNYQDRKSVV